MQYNTTTVKVTRCYTSIHTITIFTTNQPSRDCLVTCNQQLELNIYNIYQGRIQEFWKGRTPTPTPHAKAEGTENKLKVFFAPKVRKRGADPLPPL